MTTVTLTSHNFEQIVSGDGVALVDFWAAWCRPCQAFAPVFEEAARHNPDIVFGKVDTEAEQELAAAFRITSIPTLMVFRDGILVFSQPGALRAPQLDQLVEGARALDMDSVRRQITDRDASTAPA